jgi:hypothetical protein
MKKGRQERNHHVCSCDQFPAVIGFGSIKPDGSAIGVPPYLSFSQLGVSIRHSDKPVFIFAFIEQVANQRAGRAAGTNDQDIVHAHFQLMEITKTGCKIRMFVYLCFRSGANLSRRSAFSGSRTVLISTSAVFFVKSIRKIKDCLSLRRFSLT